jgi:hypothetical protein
MEDRFSGSIIRMYDPQQPSDISGGMGGDTAGPNPELTALQVTTLLMDALQNSPNPKDSLNLCFQFSSDRCRAAVGGTVEEFVKYATNPIFGSLVHCQHYEVVSVGPIIPGSIHRGDMQTVLIEITKPLTVQAAIQSKATDDRRTGRRRPTIEERIRQRETQQRQQAYDNDEDDDDDDEDGYGGTMKREEDGKKTFIWTLQKERRPPRQNCWLVHEVLFRQNAWFQTT